MNKSITWRCPYGISLKYDLKMKLTTFLLVMTLFQINAKTYSQKTRVTLDMRKVQVGDVLSKIQELTEFKFFVNTKKINTHRTVSVRVKNKTIGQILKKIFSGTDINYEVFEKQIILNSKKKAPPANNSAHQQKLTVSGTVTDSNGMPIPGVNIIVKNTNKGTQTDFDGKYNLQVTSSDAVLVFTFVGLKTQELSVTDLSINGGKATLDVQMKEDSQTLDKVVVVGYGTQKKSNLTGAVSEIDADELENRPVVNATQALQGLAPGLNITQSGAKGGSLENRPSINIRGTGTIGAGSSDSPLILIDGAEGDLNSLNPNDIANISVLKDAAASSIYGSRAPFGVILVTTKKGKAGQTRVNINSSTRMSKPILIPNITDSYSFANYINDGFSNNGETPFFSDERIQRIKDYMDGKITTTIPPNSNNNGKWADAYAQGNDNVELVQGPI